MTNLIIKQKKRGCVHWYQNQPDPNLYPQWQSAKRMPALPQTFIHDADFCTLAMANLERILRTMMSVQGC
ncbi:MAG: hypothetical protein CO065_03680 [Comamonadaceae bacterium CG_4_9_14_0_8_um_filter_57_21]|nr:MAG: hypothetical protein COY49_00725 [Comamonadaceae bacterium CG_4_10_14_0_8_um_filter_57_29]PJC21266.1 MAG: hypothetical protein CO065_03680 [Comamonadaceae bacterium CG_4_9_14_0_8_um_filter_57_21]